MKNKVYRCLVRIIEASNWYDVESYGNEIIGDLNNSVSAFVNWNLPVNLNGRPYHYRTKGCKVHPVNIPAKSLTTLVISTK